MEDWRQSITDWVDRGELLQATFSQLKRKDEAAAPRTVVRPIKLKSGLHYQFEFHYANKVKHENVAPAEGAGRMIEELEKHYRQALLKTPEADVQLLFSKKGKPAMLRKPPTAADKPKAEAHDRQKKRVLAGGAPPFLVELGIMSPEGNVYAKKQDKYRQINRFLEMVSDVLPHLPDGRELTIVDFGCGKSYLTFALYHLLAVELDKPVRVIGLDLKEDVIAFCSALAQKLGFDGLRFQVGDIGRFGELESADMVVTLHACDTATDAALAKAVQWEASVILSVPCCQHEAFGQIKSETLSPLLQHGLLKERFAALATDAARASLLEIAGYKSQILEFIDPEHTPKNILIRAVKQPDSSAAASVQDKWRRYAAYRDSLALAPYLEGQLAAIGKLPEHRS
ncbi:class I SAM-dependent methyltransferase [Paenibacillus beijingensis]|uniref:SAM-dependent methyltransferase n=1 Tax=Paenibacillus beijingensis TaxID=1126833 RepID=A0A0D5NKN6_9BACL|nr:SAM-dependent methyltransferase [Paenibacillus beijingensis]AJY75675.1 SAM-dependent methyltransferase [Paenibacillus beijingensis]